MRNARSTRARLLYASTAASDLARPRGLPENHLPVRAVTGAPVADPSLRRAPDARIEVGMAPHQFPEHAHRPDVVIAPQHPHDLLVEDPGQRIGPPTAAQSLLLGRGTGILLDAVSRGSAEASLRGRRFGRMCFPVVQESPHLVIGYMQAQHLALLFPRKFAR